MKRKTIVIFSSLIVVIIIGFFFSRIRIENIDGRRNVENSEIVKIGMDLNKVIEIMGEPDDRVVSFFDKDDSMLYYNPPFGASSGIYFQYDTDKQVINRIIPYE